VSVDAEEEIDFSRLYSKSDEKQISEVELDFEAEEVGEVGVELDFGEEWKVAFNFTPETMEDVNEEGDCSGDSAGEGSGNSIKEDKGDGKVRKGKSPGDCRGSSEGD